MLFAPILDGEQAAFIIVMKEGSLRQSVERGSVCRAYLILTLALNGIGHDGLIMCKTVFL